MSLETNMPDGKSHTSSDNKRSDFGARNDMVPVFVVEKRLAGLQTPSELESDYDSSLAGSGFLEGSWATVSSDNGVSRIDELGSSEEDGEDNASELSPRHTASAVHSESEIDALSDSQDESDDSRLRRDRTYEYVTDQSWTDPDKSTPSNSTISTFPGSYSRGLSSAKTPVHSRSSTLTDAHLKQHSIHQWSKAQVPPEPRKGLEDSQVELVFPRIPGDFGTDSVDTITSVTPLLPTTGRSTATIPAEQNFRATVSQQLPEDDYIFLADECDESGSRSSSRDSVELVAPESATHHAFLANTIDSRRGEKREEFSIIGGRILERGKHRLHDEFEVVTNDAYAEPHGREQKFQQDQLSKRIFGEITERVVDSDADGYERLDWEDFPTDTPDVCQVDRSILEARLIGQTTRCSIDQSWLNALSTARSQGLIKVDEPLSYSANEVLPGRLMSGDKELINLWETRQQYWNADSRSSGKLVHDVLSIKREPRHTVSTRSAQARITSVKKIVTVIALPFLMLIMMSRMTVMHQERKATAMSAHSIEGYNHSAYRSDDLPQSTGCPAYLSSYESPEDSALVPPFTASDIDIPVTQPETPLDPVIVVGPQTGQIRGPEFKSDDAHQLDPTGRSRNAEAESIEESAHVDDSAESTSLYQLDSLEPAPKLDYSVCSDPDKRTLRYPRDPFAENLEFGRAREPKPHMHEMPRELRVLSVSNSSRLTRFFEQSLAITTAMDMAIRVAHRKFGDYLSKHGITWPRAAPLRHSGRRMVQGQVGDLFEETDALKKRLRAKMSALLEIVDQHMQEMAVEIDKTVQFSKERLRTTIKDTAEAVERRISADAPIPFIGVHPGFNGTKSTVSTWAEKFWQTLHHATVTLVV